MKPDSTALNGLNRGSSGGNGDISDQSTYSRRGERITPEAFVIHHTGGRGTPEGVMATFNARGYPAQYIMDRDGKVIRALPEGSRGAHIMSSNVTGRHLGNDNTFGMEVIAKDDADVTAAQIEAAKKFYRDLKVKYPTIGGVYGHGYLNPGHKQATEGKTITDAIRADQKLGAQPTPDPSAAGHDAAQGVPQAERGFLGKAYRGGDKVSVWNGIPGAAGWSNAISRMAAMSTVNHNHGNIDNSRTSTAHNNIGHIVINSAAQDGQGVAADLRRDLQERGVLGQADYGLA